MNTGIKIAVSAAMIAISLTFAVFTLWNIATRPESTAVSQGEAKFTLTELNGTVAIYTGDENPIFTNIKAETLRSGDREKLRSGIEVGSEDELARLLEDLGE